MINSKRFHFGTLFVALLLVSVIVVPVLASTSIQLSYDSQLDAYKGLGSNNSNEFYTCKSPTYLSQYENLNDYIRFSNNSSGDRMYCYSVSVDPSYLLFETSRVATGSTLGVNSYSVSYESDGDRCYLFELGCSVGSEALVPPGEYAAVYIDWEWRKSNNDTHGWKNMFSNNSYLFKAGECLTGGPYFDNFVCTNTVWLN